MINGVTLFILWFVFYSFVRKTDFINVFYDEIVFFLTNLLLKSAQFVLEFFNQPSIVFAKVINILGYEGVYLDRGCLARNLQGLFAGFILAYPGSIKHKIWYIPTGLFIIFILNVFRIAGLAYIQKCCPEEMDFNHHIVFKYLVYFIILLMWILWMKYFGTKNND